MLSLKNQILDIDGIDKFASKFCEYLEIGDVILLRGELGVGKTTLVRLIINNLHLSNNLFKPNSINSPTYPILLTYELNTYEIYHYDFYRIKNNKELDELNFYENLNSSITLIEWPELLFKKPFKEKYYLIDLKLYSENKRILNANYIE